MWVTDLVISLTLQRLVTCHIFLSECTSTTLLLPGFVAFYLLLLAWVAIFSVNTSFVREGMVYVVYRLPSSLILGKTTVELKIRRVLETLDPF